MEAFNTYTDIDPPGFTPVRRKESTVNAGRLLGDQEQEWTTARCHRLLRALTSRVAILSKEISRYSTTSHQEETKAKSCEFPRSKTTTEDDDWIHPRKKIKQTYAGRGRGKGTGAQSMGRGRTSQPKHGNQSLMPGEVVVPTPILTRARGEDWEPQPNPISPTQRGDSLDEKKRRRSGNTFVIGSDSSSWQLSGTLRDMKKNLDPSRYSTYEGLYTGLETLIKSTTKDEPEKKRKGARSLFSMALKVVPQYIAEQEELLSAHRHATGSKSAITTRDMSTEVYDDLENLGSSGKSWKHLRIVVRSHGILVISDAIRAGLLDVRFCGVLITLLVELDALEEAESLLSAVLQSSSIPKPKTPIDPMDRHLVMLGKYAEHTGRFSFYYKQLSTLFADGTLPIFWLATKGFGQVWTSLIQSLSVDTTCITSRIAFLEHTLPLLASAANIQPSASKTLSAYNSVFSEACKHTFSSLLINITSILLLGSETRRFGTSDKLGFEFIVPLLQTCTIQLSLSQETNGPQKVLIFLVRLIIEFKVGRLLDTSQILDAIVEILGQPENFLDISTIDEEMAFLVSNIARSCGRGALTTGFDYLQELHIILETTFDKKDSGDFVKGIMVDSAYAFANKIFDPYHLDYASCLDSRFKSRAAPAHQNAEESIETRSGFRWEEGICEWVTKTPAPKIVKRKLSISILDEESECDTPLRPRSRKNGIQVLIQPLTTLGTISYSPVKSQVWDFDDLMRSPVNSNGQSSRPSSDDELGASDFKAGASESPESSIDCSFISPKNTIDESRSLRTRVPIYNAPRFSKRPGLRTSQGESLSNPTPPPSQESKQTRQRVVRAYKDKRGLRSSQTFQVFNPDESDDELSFVSVASPKAMWDVTNKIGSLRPHQTRNVHQKSKKRKIVSESDDELCV